MIKTKKDILSTLIQAKKELREARGEVEIALATLHHSNALEVYQTAFGRAKEELLVHRAGSAT